MKKEVVRVSGSHFDCGRQIGLSSVGEIDLLLKDAREAPPSGLSWYDYVARAQDYACFTSAFFPQIIEEIKGVAEGVNAQGLAASWQELFSLGVEELWPPILMHGCTDVAVCPPAARGVLVGHNNDILKDAVKMLVPVRWQTEGTPNQFTIGLGGYLMSVGANEHGLVLSGNELHANDIKVGIPRAYVARAILYENDLAGAVKVATHPARASSYNNVIATPQDLISVEASATDYRIIYPEDGLLVHANDYHHKEMLKYENHPDARHFRERHERARALLSKLTRPIDKDGLVSVLKDHDADNLPGKNTICQHGEITGTVFGVIFDLDKRSVDVASGNPCQNEFVTIYHF